MTGYVYAISDDRGFVKIGWSKTPERRLAEMNVPTPGKLELIGYAAGTKDHEAELHCLLADWKERGEWFRHDGPVRSFTNMLPAGAKPDQRSSRESAHVVPIVRRAAKSVGGLVRLAEALGIKHQTFYSWQSIPASRVRDIERVTGIPASQLRPDIFVEDDARAPAITDAQRLAREIDLFLNSTGMAESTFGRKAVNDGKLLSRLRSNGSVTLEKAAQIRRFIAGYARRQVKQGEAA